MSVFSGLMTYAGKWNVKSVEAFPTEDANLVASATVVNSQFGMSVCFVMKSGGMHFIPTDQNSNCNPGDSVDLSKAQVVTLCKDGEADIQRIRIQSDQLTAYVSET